MPEPEVKCYSGYTYAEEPRALVLDGEEFGVKVLRSWREPGERHFRVETEAHRTFHLCYNESNRCWSASEVGRS